MVSNRRTIAVLTTGRQDYGILRSTLLLLRADPRFDLRLYVGGMHLQARFGRYIDAIRQDGLPIAREMDFVAEPPDPVADAGRALILMAAALQADSPDALLLVGDRSETLAAALAATLVRQPLIHVHGGEETEGAIDNAIRHAVTKLSHLHLVSHRDHAERVVQMGEDPEGVIVVGAPGLDNLYRNDLPDRQSLEREFGFGPGEPLVLVTIHPATLVADPLGDVKAASAAMAALPVRYVVTQPNADAGGDLIREFWQEWSAGRPNVLLVDVLGERRYWGLLRCAAVVLGNSSSGIIEAPAIGVPVVNVGDRQKGRSRGSALIIDVPADAQAIQAGLQQAVNLVHSEGRAVARHQYLDGPAAPRIIDAISRWCPRRPPRKAFVSQHGRGVDTPASPAVVAGGPPL